MIRLKEVRESKGISRYRLEQESGITYKTLSAIEHGGDVKVSTLVHLSKVLECKLSDFFEEI